ncbi:hypothetical protein HDU76_000599 [Blyttiomyces sp. JEL0837]|nr:hypothetical protein HDU76_000599 [Blyttiomyces sp. JEL0837]
MTTASPLFNPIDSDVAAFEAGFANTDEQRQPIQLKVSGSIPSWFTGHLYRCAPSTFSFTTESGKHVEIDHWFDGLTQIHKFSVFPDGTVMYNSRKTAEDYEKNFERAQINGFAQRDPCKTLFGRITTTVAALAPSIFSSSSSKPTPSSYNIGVTISPDFPLAEPSAKPPTSKELGPRTLVAKTDAAGLQELDPTTLEPVRLFNYSDINKKFKGVISAAHGQYDADKGEYFNFTMDFGATTTFHALRISHENPSGDLVATLNNAVATYIHIIDRAHNKHIATFRSEAAYGFHTINAWEENDDIVFDLPADNSPDLTYQLYLTKLRSGSGTKWPTVRRYRLPNVTQHSSSTESDLSTLANPVKTPKAKLLPEATYEILSTVSMELPRFHPKRHRKSYKYAYGISHSPTIPESAHVVPVSSKRQHVGFADSLVKFSFGTPVGVKAWHVSGCFPGEPVFVANPTGNGDEDDGILVSVVLDGRNKLDGGDGEVHSFLLILDAKSMNEIARAELPEGKVVPFGFHGNFVSSRDKEDVVACAE